MNDLLQTVKALWISHTRPSRLPDSRELAAFESKYGVTLPADFRMFLAEVNGSEDNDGGPLDAQGVTFWRLSNILPVTMAWPGATFEGRDQWFVFADFMIESHVYAIHLSSSLSAPNPVAVVAGDDLVKVAPSFEAFLNAYLSDDKAILFPDSLSL